MELIDGKKYVYVGMANKVELFDSLENSTNEYLSYGDIVTCRFGYGIDDFDFLIGGFSTGYVYFINKDGFKWEDSFIPYEEIEAKELSLHHVADVLEDSLKSDIFYPIETEKESVLVSVDLLKEIIKTLRDGGY